MYRFEKTANHQKMLAAALVAMLAICSFACVFSEESDAAYDQSFDINMRTGDAFSYTPAVNLSDATIGTPTGSAMSAGLSWTTGTLGGSFATATGSSSANQAVITANWTNGSLSQTAKQTINFYVYDLITFNNGTSGSESYIIEDITEDMSVATINVASGQYPVTPTMTHTIAKDGGSDNGLFTFDDVSGALTAARNATAGDEGTYTVTVTATYSGDGGHANGGTVTDTKQFVYTINVGADFALDSEPEQVNTFVTNTTTSQNQFTITTNYPDETFTYTIKEVTNGMTALVKQGSAGSENVFTIDTSAGANPWDDDKTTTVKEFDVTVTVAGTIGEYGDSEVSEDITVHVKIFAELVFMDEPKIADVQALSATGNGLDALATASFSGAKSITYNWGDGTQTHVDVKNTSNPTYSARHVYDSAGTYLVTITAENDVGTQKAYMLYDATNGAWAAADETTETSDDDKGFFEEHGYLFILFAIFALLMVVVFFGVGIQHPFVAIAAIAFVILAVLCFLYDDFGLLDGFLDGES